MHGTGVLIWLMRLPAVSFWPLTLSSRCTMVCVSVQEEVVGPSLLFRFFASTATHSLSYCVCSFDPKRAVQQLRACGVLETIRISAAGYPSR